MESLFLKRWVKQFLELVPLRKEVVLDDFDDLEDF